MKNVLFYAILASIFLIQSCQQDKSVHTVTIKNALDVPRSFETVEINKTDLKLEAGEAFGNFSIQDAENKTVLISQFVDKNEDGIVDVLLFQPEIAAKSEKQFELVVLDEKDKPEATDYCYSRFVPETTDDYAWLKKVEYPIINKWYEKNIREIGSYHKDSGEGLDNFHVGVSRGVGGIAVKNDTTYYVTKNFANWKTITTGPIRTSFVLEYVNWDAYGQTISEKKHISLDLGSNLSKFEIEISGTDSFYSGLTLHENDGEPTQNQEAGWISYWQPHGDSELGTAIDVPNEHMMSLELYVTTLKDQSNLFAQIKANNPKGIYYAGFGWKVSKQFLNKGTWESFLNDFALKINNPLLITLK